MPLDFFPYYSPNNRYYVEVKQMEKPRLWIMEMYRSSDGKLLGQHAAIDMTLLNWVPDSSGLIVRDNGILLREGGWMIPDKRIHNKPSVIVLVPK